jgi:cell division protein ZapE
MQEVHDRLHDWRQASKGSEDDPLPRLAEQLASGAWLLCFDELHVGNIADAMILGRLFEALFEAGVVVVATSNFAPDRLYEGGLQRENFLPFIEVLKTRLDLLELDSGLDYRLRRLQSLEVYHSPLDEAAARAQDEAFAELTAGALARPIMLDYKGRGLVVPIAARGVARFSFAELCEAPLGAIDYLELVRRFHTLVLDGVPRIGPERRNETRRFMILIDTLYDNRVNLVISAEAPPQDLYPEGPEAEEFQRTASRLVEMQSKDYITTPHKG